MSRSDKNKKKKREKVKESKKDKWESPLRCVPHLFIGETGNAHKSQEKILS